MIGCTSLVGTWPLIPCMINHLTLEKNWQPHPNDFVTSIHELMTLLELPDSLIEQVADASHFPLRVPRHFVTKMQVGNPHDPLLKQVLPLQLEHESPVGFSTDPLSERAANLHKSIIHKYASRVLLTLTGACAVHCRYCFRQHFDYQANLPKSADWQRIMAYISQDDAIHEVIFSGGDPLSLNNRQLGEAITQIESLSQIDTLRLHTRVPVVMPQRIDQQLCERLSVSRLHVVMVIHANHPHEVDDETAQYLSLLKAHGVTLLNQSVLLKGINDSAETLCQLSQRLFTADVLPYYVHLLDPVVGAAHFDIAEANAAQIYWQMAAKLPGYLLPRFVKEKPATQSKVPIALYGHDVCDDS